jgi:hypothetical protein
LWREERSFIPEPRAVLKPTRYKIEALPYLLMTLSHGRDEEHYTAKRDKTKRGLISCGQLLMK